MFETVVLPAASLWRREMVRFFRQRSRVIGSLATPLMFWLLFSAGYGPSLGADPAAGEGGAFAFFLPGTLALILLFTSIFANISIIEDRKEGFLQAVLAAPVSRLGIVLGKVLGGATIAVIQGVLFLLLAAVTGLDLAIAPAEAFAAIVVLAVAMTALGFVFAWTMDTVQAFHGIMNLVLMPLWLLSGALFPAAGTPIVLRLVMLANPVTYGLATLRHSLGMPSPDVPSAAVAWAVSGGFAALLVIAAVAVALRPQRGAGPRKGR
jgi:ABC-2 type transport system permease protein